MEGSCSRDEFMLRRGATAMSFWDMLGLSGGLFSPSYGNGSAWGQSHMDRPDVRQAQAAMNEQRRASVMQVGARSRQLSADDLRALRPGGIIRAKPAPGREPEACPGCSGTGVNDDHQCDWCGRQR